VGAMFGLVSLVPQASHVSDIFAVAGKSDIAAASKIGLLDILFVFLFVDLFDNLGTLVGVGMRAGLFDENGRIPRIRRILLSDAAAAMAGSVAGTSTVTSYIESAAGVAAGGRSGITAIVTGLLFFIALFIAPLAGAIPSAATAPALIIAGSLMLSHLGEVPWNDPGVAIPAFLTLITIPLSFSIANGLAFGFVSYALLRVLRGQFRETHWLVYLLAALFIARFIYLGAE
jgi:AGZA family xanthine/uracil permease-like MFS transporter